MKKPFLTYWILTFVLVLFFVTSCKKDSNDDKNDLTTNILGKYTNPNDYDLEIVVNKIDNSTVSMTIKNGYFDYAFTNVKMNSATSFTLTPYSFNSGCFISSSQHVDATTTVSGTGTASNNNISVFIEENHVASTGSCNDSNDSYSFSATK